MRCDRQCRAGVEYRRVRLYILKLILTEFGKRVWCGINVTIIAGVTIGDDVVLGAGSVVCKDIPSNSIAVGVPAKVIKPLIRDVDSPLWSWVS